MTLRLNGSTSGYVEIDAPAVAGSNTLTLPTGNGTSGQVLSTNGSGALSWGSGGKILQVVETNYTTSASSITAIPLDNTIPQNTEGTEVLSASITPTSSSNKLLFHVTLPFIDADTARVVCAALFQDSTANALATGFVTPASALGYATNITFTHYMTTGTTSSTTFKVRYGPNAGTAYINRRSSAETYGNVAAARLIIMELAV